MLDQQVFGCDDLNANTVCDLGEPLVDAPDNILVGQDVPIMMQTVVQNGGPFGSVNAAAETIATAPTGCQITPPSHLESIVNLPVGLNVTLKAPFTIRCDGSGQHTFSFDNAMDIDNMEHVRDPDAGNNTAHTELTVTAS